MTDTVTRESAAEEPVPRHHVEGQLSSPASTTGLLDVFRHRYLLRLLVRREISSRYQKSLLGLGWSYVQPAVRLFMFYFVLGEIVGLNRRVENFGIHLFAGFVLVHFFTETFNAGTRSFMSNKDLVGKLSLPREMFPVASMLVSLYHTVPGLVVLLIVCLVTGWSPDLLSLWAVLLAFGIVILLGTALAVLFSALNVFFQDFGKLVMTLTQFVNFSVPMIYPFTFVPQRFGTEIAENFYLLNPMAEAVLLMQRCFWSPTTKNVAETNATHFPDHLFTRGLIMLAASALFLAFSQWMFSRMDNKIPERL